MSNEVKLCECGCGQPAPIATKTDPARGYVGGEPRRFILGHGRKINPPEGTRWCSGCQNFRPIDSFSSKGYAYCRVCANNKRQEWVSRNPDQAKKHGQNAKRKMRYSITVPEFDSLVASQDNRCAICNSKPRSGKVLHVDHDHETGKVRGLLCNTCNVGLGSLKDDPQLLRLAASYLEARS